MLHSPKIVTCIAALCLLLLLPYEWCEADRPLGIDPNWDGISNPHPELDTVGERFRFAIIADAQVGHADDSGRVAKNAAETLRRAVDEINSMEPPVAFIVHLGDVVNVPDQESFQNFYNLVRPYRGLHVLVHGNHDTSPPYTEFRQLVRKLNGIESVYYSFDAGKWHFVVLPANTEFGNYANLEVNKPMMQWLRTDLEINKNRPTAIFLHIHIMPMGLSQLEWYTYTPGFKRELIDVLAKWGNVKWVFNGHVHNGIKVSSKTAWTYRGINFLTVPTITASRPYGEEFPQFAEGMRRGGFYAVVDVDGDALTVRGRLAGVADEYVFADSFQPFAPEKDVRLLTRSIDLPPKSAVENPGFEEGLQGWYACPRYVCDGETGYLNEWRMKHKREGAYSAYLYVIPMGIDWAQDEYNELFQIVATPGPNPVFRGSYYIEHPADSGGGYFRLVAIGGEEGNNDFKFLMQLGWSSNEDDEYKADYYPRAVGYHTTGNVSSWTYLQDIGARKQGLFLRLPSETARWHDVQVSIAEIYDRAVGQPGAYAQLGVTKFLIAAGVWTNKDVRMGSGAFFDSIALESGDGSTSSSVNAEALNIDDSVFTTQFGQGLADRLARSVSTSRPGRQ